MVTVEGAGDKFFRQKPLQHGQGCAGPGGVPGRNFFTSTLSNGNPAGITVTVDTGSES